MKTYITRCLLALTLIVGYAYKCEGQVEPRHIVAEINSESIAKNIIGDSPVRKLHIYLPPSYYQSAKKYPVVYFLHGYGDSPLELINTHGKILDSLFRKGAKEFILVVFDGNNKTGGSFYTNSPVSGNWEDFVVSEVVEYMDQNFKTLPQSGSRGIAGYSMGGFGALIVAFRHPDVFCSVFTFAPGNFAEGHLHDVFESWTGCDDVKHSYAQAFSPNPKNKSIRGNVPSFSNTVADNAVVADWNSGFGNWQYKIGKYLALGNPLRGVQLSCSTTDFYKWIPEGCLNISQILNQEGIKNEIIWYDGGHIVPNDCMPRWFVPFFERMLDY